MAILDGKKIMLIGLKGDKGDLGGTYPLGETDGTAYEGSKGKANADAIKNNTRRIETIEQVHLQDGSINILETEQAYTTRETAAGAEIYDEQYTAVKEIKGSTVADSETNTLKHAFIKAIKSTGRNLIKSPYDFTTYTVNGITYTAQSDGGIKATGTATATAIRNLNTTPCRTNTASSNGASGTGGGFTISGGKGGVVVAINAPNGMAYMYVEANQTVDTVIYPMLQYGKVATAYEPYKADESFMFAEAVELAEWDYIDTERGKVVRETKTVAIDGTQAVNINRTYTSKLLAIIPTACSKVGAYLIAIGLPVIDWNDVYADNEVQGVHLGTDGTFYASLLLANLESADANGVKAFFAQNPTTICTKHTDKTETDLAIPTDRYKTWKHGSETVIQGETDNSAYGAMPTIKNEYFTAVSAGGGANE